MKTKTTIIAIVLIASCVAMPFFAGAATSSSSSPGFFGSIFSAVQNAFGFIFNIFAPSNNSSSSTTATATSTPAEKSVTLKLGDKNVLVTVVQEALIKYKYMKGPVTGTF